MHKNAYCALVKTGPKESLNELFRKNEENLGGNMTDVVEKTLNEHFEKMCEFKSILSLGLKNLYRTSADYNIIDKATKEIKLLGGKGH